MQEIMSSELTIRGYTNTIYIGQKFKNFKELAGHFGINYKPGATSTKRAIEKELKQYFSWWKLGPNSISLEITQIFLTNWKPL